MRGEGDQEDLTLTINVTDFTRPLTRSNPGTCATVVTGCHQSSGRTAATSWLSSPDVYVLTDDDDKVLKDWLTTLVSSLSR